MRRPPDPVDRCHSLELTVPGPAVSFATLARAGRVAELAAGGVAGADVLFATAPGPASCTGF